MFLVVLLISPYVRGDASAQRCNENWVHYKNGDWGAIRYDYYNK